MERKISFNLEKEYVHFLLDDKYLGMLVFGKGELSDFRAIIRKNRLVIEKQNIEKTLKVCLHELLNQYLVESEYLDHALLQKVKTKIVKSNEAALKSAVEALVRNEELVL